MPIYEYHCEQCQQTFELLVKSQQLNTTAACPHCGATKTKKLFSSFAAPSSQSSISCENAAACQTTSQHHCCGGCPCHQK